VDDRSNYSNFAVWLVFRIASDIDIDMLVACLEGAMNAACFQAPNGPVAIMNDYTPSSYHPAVCDPYGFSLSNYEDDFHRLQ